MHCPPTEVGQNPGLASTDRRTKSTQLFTAPSFIKVVCSQKKVSYYSLVNNQVCRKKNILAHTPSTSIRNDSEKSPKFIM